MPGPLRPARLRRPPGGPAARVGRRRCAAAIAVVLAFAGQVSAQSTVRRLTTVEALHEFASYFHLQLVLVRGEFVERDTELVFRADGQDIRLMNPEAATSGFVEVRGQVIDVGRLDPEDPRLGSYVDRRGRRDWPQPGTELLLNITDVTDAQFATTPSIRAVALEPWKFEGQTITLVGNFHGRNLFGDLPAAPGKGRDDFVLSSAEAAVWITGKEPKGRGFDLDVARRLDTNKWLEVKGVLTRCGALVCLDARDIALADPPAAVAAEPEPRTPAPPPPPAQVVFSIPTPDQTDVPVTTTVRIQFSKGLREATLDGRLRATYTDAEAPEAPLTFTTTYDLATRALRMTFDEPLRRFSTVKVDLLEGITAFDGAPIRPWSLTFSVGGR